MATVGLKLVQFGLIDSTGKIIANATTGLSTTGLYQVDDGVISAKTANITGIEVAPTQIYGNNKVVDLSTAKGSPSVALDFNDLPYDVLSKMLGRISDGKGGYTIGDKPRLAMLIGTQSLDRKNNIYFGFANGQLINPDSSNGTDTNAETRADDTLTYTAIGADAWDGEAIKTWYDADSTFDQAAMMADVFGGYILPSTGQ
ncbi:phage tail protein [Oenococcus oeni]|uniref:phage tail protein n=1 Tax=Oenococcus oeni TaxID=1247 RepID=UPI0008F7F18F|nr:phage tail protein [Oenococcus oeni]OIL58302.1 phage tail protein [Oenococcus oeni]